MAHFQTGDRICYRKGGPTYRVQNVLDDGRVLVSRSNGRSKLLTRPEEFVSAAGRSRRVAMVTFVIDRQKHLDGRSQFTILRIRENRLDVVSRHAVEDDAWEAACSYASQARFSGLNARVLQRD